MKDDKWLYEFMDEINDGEAVVLENSLNALQKEMLCENANALKRQESMAMDKIRAEMQREKQSKVQRKTFSRFRRRKFAVLAAAAVMMFSMVAFAWENDWDIEMADMLGLSDVMEQLDGGYVRLGVADKQDGITVTAVQAIGDQNFQWIQLDTDISWDVGEDGYYMFDEFNIEFMKWNGKTLDGGATFYSYNNNGMVSFMFHAQGVEKINRAKIRIELGKLCQYEHRDAEGVLISDGVWELTWKNYYASNTITKHPLEMIHGYLIRKVEISPISVRVDAIGMPSEEMNWITIEQIILEDGTVIACQEMGGGNSNNVLLDNYVIYEKWESIDLDEIKSVVINGEEVEIR